jgi:hypothetical protein
MGIPGLGLEYWKVFFKFEIYSYDVRSLHSIVHDLKRLSTPAKLGCIRPSLDT